MEQYNVMPPAPTGENQPVHRPNITTPPPPTPPIPGMNIERPNRLKQFFSNKGWKFLLIIPVIIILAILIFGYFVLARGQTVLGEKLQDEIWESIITNTNKETKDFELSVTYTDAGKYEFKPSNFIKQFSGEMSDEEIASLNNQYGFTISDFTASAKTISYLELADENKPKVDFRLEGAVSNNEKSFEGSIDMKLKDSEAYARYDYNTNTKDFMSYFSGGYSPTDEQKNRWQKITEEYALTNLRDTVKIFTLLSDPSFNSDDAKRLADIRQLMSALELYYDDKGEYPNSENGKPKNLADTYLGIMPTAPKARGNCSEDMNNYLYEAIKDESGKIVNYNYTFCLSKTTSGLTAGNKVASNSGINNYDCPSNRKCAAETSSDNSTELNPYQKLLVENRLFDIKSLKGATFIDGKPVLHYELELNKGNLKNYINKSLEQTFTDNTDKDTIDFLEEVSDELISKINVDNYDIWIGVYDRKLYKSDMTIDAISITKAGEYLEKSINDPNNPITKGFQESLETSQSKSRDAKRLADVRQMASALELFYNDNSQYPASSNGQPIGITPTYIGALPVAPSPADGECDDYFNTYWYIQTSPNSYTLSFCLGESTGGISAGKNEMSQAGFLVSGNSNNGEPLQDNSSDPVFESFKSSIINTIKNLSFDAKIRIEYSAKNFGKTKDIPIPEDYDEPTVQVNFID